MAPDRKTGAAQPLWGPRWAWYQILRFLILWTAIWIDATAFGVMHAACVSVLFGFTIRFDYWSNCVELLAACFVASAGVLGVSWGWCVALGPVLGLGRETLPLLALAGGIEAATFAAMAAIPQALLWRFTRTGPEWVRRESETEHGQSQLVWNLEVLLRPQKWALAAYSAIYLMIAALAFPNTPILTTVLVGLTFWRAKIDEPRVLTMLIPFGAQTLCRVLS